MELEYIRDYVMYIAIFGMFSFVWFGWAQEKPRKNWRKYIGIASGIALLVCLFGVYLSVTHWDAATTLSEKDTFNSYLIVFYTEFFIAGLGAFLLIRSKKKDYVAPWIAFIVGVHFFWLVNIFKDPSLYILAVLMIAIAVISPWGSKRLGVASSAITGIGSGIALFCFAILGLIRYLLA
ncbi:hypothetical protein [Cytobacillus depressus]|uniref:hypothetical protein n=1 Tax=Cytobacillus depressus TaxID=1602942 RepID=UPI001FE89D50|nr:hypothetical protein [Cytobacillus depressus]